MNRERCFATGWSYSLDELYRVNNNPGIRPSPGQIDAPPQWIPPDAGKMPKLNQWSISPWGDPRDLVVDVAYVGNRGDGFTANNLMHLNALSNERLQSFGLDVNNANDRALLTGAARLDAGGIARVGQRAAVSRIFRREHRGAEPAAVPAVRQHRVDWRPVGCQ